MRVLFIGDVVGGPGRRGLRETMPLLRERHVPDLIVVNGENTAGGVGLTERTANDLFGMGTGVITSGNHVYRPLDQVEADAAIVDFHAEVTSEKVAMGWHLDGRVAAVFGTHTHVPTADGRILPKGTAFICDVGMTGSRTSVLGVKPEQALASLITQMPTRFETAEDDIWVMGALVDVNERGLADSFEQVMVPAVSSDS